MDLQYSARESPRSSSILAPSQVTGKESRPGSSIDWPAVVGRIAREFGSTRLNGLKQVNEIIRSVIQSSRALSEEAGEDFRQLTLGLDDNDSSANVGHLEQRLIDLCFRILARSKELENVHVDPYAQPLGAYGGEAGNAIFKTMIRMVVVPLLTSVMRECASQMKGMSYADKFDAARQVIHALLTLAGDERGKIAKATASPTHEAFGLRLMGGIVDHVCIGKWKPWQDLVVSKIHEILAPAWATFQSGHDNTDPQDFLLKNPLRGEATALQFQTWRGTRIGTLTASRDGLKVEFTFAWSMQDDREAATCPVVISELKCCHIRSVSVEIGELETRLAPAFIDALLWSGDLQQLQDSLASSFYDLARSSAFERGLASITEVFTGSIAALHGYALTFSKEWQPPDHPAPDQQALSEFDRDRFIEAARTHIVLQPM